MGISTETIRKITVQGSGQQSLDALAASLERVKVAQEKVDKTAAAGIAVQERAAKAALAVAAAQEKLEKSGGSVAAQEKLVAAQERSAKASAAVYAHQERMAAAQASLTKATSVQAGVTDTSAKKQLSAAEAYRNQTLAIDANARMQDVVAKKVGVATAAFNQGVLGDVNSAAAKAALATRIADINNKYGQASTAARAYAAATSGVSAQLVAMSAGAGPVGTFLSALGPWGIAAAVGVGVVGAGIGVLASKSTQAVEAYRKFEEESLTLNSMLKSTGFAAGKSAEDIERMATEIGNISEVRKAGIELVKFGTISSDVFERTMVLADDLSAAGFGSISSAASALGKALESPADGLTRLRRAGIIFNDSQIATVKNMQETGRLAEAQQFILDELAKKVGGAGAARDQGLAGSYEALGDATQRLLERWGRQITTGLNLTGMIKSLATEIDKANARETPEGRLAAAERNLAARGGGAPRNMGVSRNADSLINKGVADQKAEIALLRLNIAEANYIKLLEAEALGVAARDAAAARSQELIKGTVRELEKETDALRKNAFERAADAAMRKAEVAPGSSGEGEIKRTVNTKMATEATQQFIESTRQNSASLKIEAAAMGMSAAGAARYKVEQELLSRESAKGVKLSEEQRAAIKATASEFGSATAMVEAYKAAEAKRSQVLTGSQGIETAKLELSLVGQGAEAQERLIGQLRIKQQLEQEAARTKIPVDQAHLQLLQEQIAKEAELNQQRRQTSAQANAGFALEIAGMSSLEQQIASVQRQLHGDDWKSFMDDGLSATLRLTDGIRSMKDATQQFAQTFVQGLMNGKNGAEALRGALSQLASTAANAGIKNLLEGDFVMAAINGIVAIGAMILGTSKKAEEEAHEKEIQAAKDAWARMEDSWKSWLGSMTGSPIGSVQSSIQSAMRQALDFNLAIGRANDSKVDSATPQDALDTWKAFQEFSRRSVTEFNKNWNARLADMNAGIGSSSPFAKALDDIKRQAELVEGFVSDTLYSFGGGAHAEILADDARKAGQAFLLSLLKTAPVLSETQVAIQELSGKASGLQQALIDLGMSADEAAAAISDGVGLALALLKESFVKDINAEINDATGKGYLNDLSDLKDTTSEKRADAVALGVDPALIDRYYKVQAQKIVDGAGLVGDSFKDLLKIFPELTGIVHESTQAIERQVQFQKQLRSTIDDFLFSLKLGSTSTLSPQAKFEASKAEYEKQLKLAQSGDKDAAMGLTKYAQTYLEQARGYLGPSAEFGKVSESVTKALDVLPDIKAFKDPVVAGLDETVSWLQVIAKNTGSDPVVPDNLIPLFQGEYQGGAGENLDRHFSNERGGYALGGIVGNGTYNIDSVRARYAGGGDIAVAGGEFITRATSVNSSTMSALDFINRTGQAPGNDNSDLLAELRALRAEVRALRSEQSQQIAKGNELASDVVREVKSLRTDTKQSANEKIVRKKSAA